MADFLTRLIERSRNLVPPGQRLEPLIPSLYGARPHFEPSDEAWPDEVNLVSVDEPESPSSPPVRPASVPRSNETDRYQRPAGNISVQASPQRYEPRVGAAPEAKSTPTSTDEIKGARLTQTPAVKPSPSTATLNSPLAPANERAGVSGNQSQRAVAAPVVIQPQPLVRNGESKWRTGEPASDNGAPIIRVTIDRIDVRAVSLPSVPPARRAPPPGPRQSLEEYLRSRSVRKR